MIAQTLFSVVGVVAASVAEPVVQVAEACPAQPAVVSLVQFDHEVVAKKQGKNKKCEYEGQPCNEFGTGDGFICYYPFGASRTMVDQDVMDQGRCERTDNTMFRCMWTQRGTQHALEERNCDATKGHGINRCPRVRDPVEKASWLSDVWDYGVNNDKWYKFMEEMWYADYVQCNVFVLACSWTQMGVEWSNPAFDPRPTAGSMVIKTHQELAQRYKQTTVSIDDIRTGNKRKSRCPGGPGCPVAGQEVTHSQGWEIGLAPWKRLWKEIYQEKGLLICTSPQQAYASWFSRPVRAALVQCDNLAYNCDTREQAEYACKVWSGDPAVPGSGTAELCYKHELGETVGRSCRWTWTMDSDGKEGCYESAGVPDGAAGNGNNGPGPDALPETCQERVGLVRCHKLKEAPPADAVMFPLKPEHQVGFDAACCEGHLAEPYYMYKKRGQYP